MARRLVEFSMTTKRIMEIARENGFLVKDIRQAEKVLMNFEKVVSERLDEVALVEIRRVCDKVEEKKEVVIVPEDVIEAAEEVPESEEEDDEDKKKVFPCPVCDRKCRSEETLAKHLDLESKTCYKHKEYITQLNA